jgi:hypothetical protein
MLANPLISIWNDGRCCADGSLTFTLKNWDTDANGAFDLREVSVGKMRVSLIRGFESLWFKAADPNMPAGECHQRLAKSCSLLGRPETLAFWRSCP